MKNLNYLIILIISAIIMTVLLLVIKKTQKTKKQIYYSFITLVGLMLVWTISLIMQILCQNTSIPPVYFEYTAAFGGCFLSVAFFFFALIMSKTKIKFKLWYLLLFVIPILSCICLWTNDFHHLFYAKYSINLNDTIKGPFIMVHSVYTFALFILAIFILFKYSFKTSGFFSKQSLLIVLGALIPLVVNLLGMLGIPMTVYLTPICFTLTILFFALAVFRFGLMKVTPIALQTIVDKISDGYLVLDENGIITDFNATVLKMFNLDENYIRGKNLFDIVNTGNYFSVNTEKLKNCIDIAKDTPDTFHFEKKLVNEDKYFNIEINSIQNDKTFLGILVLFKDTTQHMLDMQTIKNNQDMLLERERLASLGQLIGGIAHNLKTPIMSISGAAEGLTDLVKEYEASVGDPEVTVQDHHDIAKDMKDWIEKIHSYTEYMSDIITAVKGQAVTMSEEQAVSFTLDELVKRVNILMKHELKNALVELNVSMQVNEQTVLKGNINSLVQVINNMISNAIQAYDGKPDNKIDLILKKENNNIIISVKDYGCGLPDEVQKKLFKEMITTKGKNGTGLGLFMSYSTIRAHFNGNMTFETEQGKGTTFNIILPL